MNELSTITKTAYDAAYNVGEQYYNIVKNIEEIALMMRKGGEDRDVKKINAGYDEFEKIRHNLPIGISTMVSFFYGNLVNGTISEKEELITETYLILNTTTEFHKIGKTRQGIEKRMSQFAGMSAGNCYVIGSVNKDIENILHKKYKNKRIKGEWFNLSKKEVDEIIEIFGQHK